MSRSKYLDNSVCHHGVGDRVLDQLIFFFFFLHVILSFHLFIAVCTEIKEYYPAEREALLQLRDALTSNLNLHSNWTGPPCINNTSRWAGVACSSWHVDAIVLEGIELTGSLPSGFLEAITLLTTLSLRNNSISGQLPNLTNLVFLKYVLLSYNRFIGSIPLEYVDLPSLESLTLEQNYLEGRIPPFDQASLTSFNVSYNHLQGPIPATDVLQRFPTSSYDTNKNLCGKPVGVLCPAPSPAEIFSPPPSSIAPTPGMTRKKRSHKTWTIILISSSAALLLLVMLTMFCFCKRKQAKDAKEEKQAGYAFGRWAAKMSKMFESDNAEDDEKTGQLEFFSKEIPPFDLDDLLRASAEELGTGNLGTAYRVTLETGPTVVVKRLKDMNGLSKKEFLQQIQLTGNLKHENLVDIIASYFSEKQKLIISEFIPHGTLFELLHENRESGRTALDWSTRLAIIKDIAKGLAFLHQAMPSGGVPHGNLKSSNVIIQKESTRFLSKFTDFGFFPLLPARKFREKLAMSKTPEFVHGKKLTHKSDVYCFGILLLEIVTGRIPGEAASAIEETMEDLSDWVRMVVNNDWSTDILDLEIRIEKAGHEEMLQLTEIALRCTEDKPEKRPRMNEVLKKIEEIEQRQR